MNTVFTYSFYGLAALLLLFSFLKDKRKTLLSLKKAWKMFTGVLPQFVAILLFVGVALAVLSPETIRPVSYTHLDVYKRQVPGPSPNSAWPPVRRKGTLSTAG